MDEGGEGRDVTSSFIIVLTTGIYFLILNTRGKFQHAKLRCLFHWFLQRVIYYGRLLLLCYHKSYYNYTAEMTIYGSTLKDVALS